MGYQFNGIDDYFSQAVSNTAYPCTLAAWVNLDNTTGFKGLVTWRTIGNSSKASIRANGSALGALSAGTGSGSANGAGGIALSAATWHSAVGTFPSDSSRTGFVDGAGGTPNTGVWALSTLDSLLIGAMTDSTGTGAVNNFHAGIIAWVGLWAGTLNADQINSLVKGFSPEQVAPQSLINAWWLLRELIGIKGGSLTLNGAPSVVPQPRGYA